MTTQNDTEIRISEAANRLYEAAGRDKFPTVDAVRREARADMNTTTLVMKSWRRQQTAQPEAVRSSVPDSLRNAWLERHESALVSLWDAAQALSNEALESAQAAWEIERQESEKLLAEASQAYDDQTAQLNSEMDEHIAAIERADAAEQRINTLEHELKDTQNAADNEKYRLKGIVAGLESQLSDARTREDAAHKANDEAHQKLDAANYELATVKGELATAQKLSDSLSSDLDKHDKTIEKLRNELSQTQSQANSAQHLADERKEALDKSYKAHEKALADLRADFQSHISSIASDAKDTQKALEDCRSALSDSEKGRTKYEAKNESLEQRISAVETENAWLKEQAEKPRKKQ